MREEYDKYVERKEKRKERYGLLLVGRSFCCNLPQTLFTSREQDERI